MAVGSKLKLFETRYRNRYKTGPVYQYFVFYIFFNLKNPRSNRFVDDMPLRHQSVMINSQPVNFLNWSRSSRSVYQLLDQLSILSL